MRLARDLHPVAWWVWAVGLAVAASCTTNPLLLLVLLGVISLVVLTCRSDQPWARSFRLYVWLGVVVLVVRILFRVLLGGDAPGQVLFTLPSIPLPDWAATSGVGYSSGGGAPVVSSYSSLSRAASRSAWRRALQKMIVVRWASTSSSTRG